MEGSEQFKQEQPITMEGKISQLPESPYMHVKQDPRVYLMIRRAKSTLCIKTTDKSPLSEVKATVKDILGIDPSRQRLYLKDQVMEDDNMTMAEYLKEMKGPHEQPLAHHPVTLGLALMGADGQWESLNIEPVSEPDPLPGVLQASADLEAKCTFKQPEDSPFLAEAKAKAEPLRPTTSSYTPT